MRGEHLVGLIFQNKVAAVEQMEFEVREVAIIGVSAVGREDEVVLTPDDQCRRLMLAQVLLHFRIERQIGSVVVEDIELNIIVAGPIKKRLVMGPVIRRDAARVRNAVGVLEFCRLQREEFAEGVAAVLAAVRPVFLIGPKILADLLRRHCRSAR